MLNQFYNYLADKLTDFLETQSLKGGERFYLQFDEKTHVKEFADTLNALDNAEPFKYTHEKGSPFETFALNINGIRVVVAATKEDVKPDYLVTLRNKAGEQTDKWEKTALLSICDETLDSIRGGSSDLQKEGMPFHVKSIVSNLKEEIEKSNLMKHEREVLDFHLDTKLKDIITQPSLFDFEEVLSLLHQEKIPKVVYSQLGLFYDGNLSEYTNRNAVNKRLEENADLYERVQHIHEYENLDQQLEKLFDDKGVKKLKREDWQQVEYKDVKESNDQLKKLKGEVLSYHEKQNKLTNEKLTYWEKAQNENTKPGQRKRHIIVFNPDSEPIINMTFEFDEYLRKDYLTKNSLDIAEVKGKKLHVSIPSGTNETTFRKVSYKHNNENKSSYDFYICIVECTPSQLEGIKTYYSIDSTRKNIVITSDEESVIFGLLGNDVEEITLEQENETIQLMSGKSFIVSGDSPAWTDDTLTLTLKTGLSSIPIKLKEQVVKLPPVLGQRVWKLKREHQEHFFYKNNKLQQGTREFNIREEYNEYLMYESRWINEEMRYAHLSIQGLESMKLDINPMIEEAYQQLLEYYQNHTLPSLSYMDTTLIQISRQFLQAYNNEIDSINEGVPLTTRQKNLFLLGTIRNGRKVLLTPLHPLNILYQLKVNEELEDEQVESHILERLKPNNLLPYIYEQGDVIYKPVNQNVASEWLIYEPLNHETLEGSDTYHANLIEEKMKQFIDHFRYLFLHGSKAPLKVNVINMSNDKEVLRGIIQFLKSQVEKNGLSAIVPVAISIYHHVESESAFESFSMYNDTAQIEQIFDVSLQTKNLDPIDMLRIIRDNIQYYKLKNNGEYRYAHISFYRMANQEYNAKNRMNEIDSGMALDGLLSSLNSLATQNDFRTGFGTKHSLHDDNLFMQTVRNMNEFASNLDNEGRNPYSKRQSIVTMSSSLQEGMLDNLYNVSHWVTFIDPHVDLEYFQRSAKELLVIHYSDQYSSSDKYDAITVTDKNLQYAKVIEQYLLEKDIYPDTKDINSAIRAFNSINGEWLLRIIGSKGHFSREKLSIVSAIKYSLSLHQHDKIIWVPISLEEILRVAGAVKLTKSEGVFSASNLGIRGATSDDILLVGVEIQTDDIFIHFYPIEVKIGSDQRSKAKEQIEKTKSLFDDQLKESNDEGERPFKNKFFRNFFVQMLLANARKFTMNKLWNEKHFDMLENVKGRLLNDDFHIGYHLEKYIGKGAILSFRSGGSWRSAILQDDVMNVQLAEEDAYTGLVEDISAIRLKMEQGKLDLPKKALLSNLYRGESSALTAKMAQEMKYPINDEIMVESEKEMLEKQVVPAIAEVPNIFPSNTSTVIYKHEEEVHNEEDTSVSENLPELEDVRVLIGNIQGSTKQVYWEYGHSDLANRHILISGKSGQGKTYFIQSMLMELAQQGISSIIFDYTDGFKKSQLENQFKDHLGTDLINYLVAMDKFPINPFKRNQKEIDEGIYMTEDYSDVAERTKSVFSAIYRDLGHQQLNAIYQATIRGLKKYEEQMNLEVLREELQEDGSGPAKTALAQISLLIDKNPFDHTQANDWSKLGDQKGKVHIVQMTTYTRDVQLMITEFILWDIWHYKVQHGDKSLPFPVILDEAQNLDHSDKSPSSKILTEGRKFGWSGWYATQFLKGQLTSDEISRLQNASQKIFFQPPENEISSIAAMLGHDASARKEWEKKLSSLKKGQCVSYGPVRNEKGELQNSVPVVIDITSMEKRF
ncbi:DNA phosphorothioation-dependent restriction protein DptH [Pontibacillus litoralis]|uniref:DNA phosphorothioation-dependent restriction protein DptH n=1 Tax=Pontibacillus litoralis TaxID=516703 RepID=UPI0005629F22|nr:DNA phosphorothioation-dependent restriction protein DptH [Pontibacillus litoralis]